RVIVKSDGKTTITAMINPLTEVIARKVLATSNTKLADVDDVTTDLATANTAVGKAFNAEGVDISSTKPAVVNANSYDSSASAGAKALGQALAGISGMETKDRNGDATKTTDAVLTSLVSAIDDNGVLKDDERADFLAGLEQAKTKNSTNMSDDYIARFETSISGISISEDTVYNTSTDSDFITKIKAQTITATLKADLNNEMLWGRVNSSVAWEDITSKASGTSISWDKDLQEGENIIQFAITANGVNAGDVTDNIKGNIALQSYTLDTTNPLKAIIEKAITDNNNNLLSGGTTNDSTPKVRISLTNTSAEKDDRVQVMKDDGTGYTHSQYVRLNETDITRGWKEVALSTLTLDGNKDNKTYNFKVKIIDQVGNQSQLSDAYSIIFDGNVEQLTLTLKDDTGTSSSDGITNNKIIKIGNIEKDAKVEYILDGGDGWITLASSAITYNADDKGTAEIELNENTNYAANNIKVRQTDDADNVSGESKNSAWKIDNTAVEYNNTEDVKISRVKNENTNAFESHIVLTFTEDIVKLATFDTNSFTILIGTNQVANSDIKSVTTSGKKATIVLTADINAANELKLSYAQSDSDKALQDKAGNILTTISEQTFPIDNVAPTKPTIESVVDNKGDEQGVLVDDAITDDRTLEVKVSFTNAVEGDFLKYYNTKDNDELLKTITLTQSDIDKGYITTTLYLDSSTEGKDYGLIAKLVDKTGNISDASTIKNFTVDVAAATPDVVLKIDSGYSNRDGITNNNSIEVSNI
ncbi:MAG: hypothetical protein PSN35_07190, partial [Candidatus Thioglobus sp.]|uniref:hypothetical protein n=1 Tax=Candidatus Thioglobus sp. TaxID=2026721 RepID=UPI0026108B1C